MFFLLVKTPDEKEIDIQLTKTTGFLKEWSTRDAERPSDVNKSPELWQKQIMYEEQLENWMYTGRKQTSDKPKFLIYFQFILKHLFIFIQYWKK